MTKSYDPNEDYQKKMDEAAKAGDYAAAARYEQQRNEKIQGEGLMQYQTTNQYAGYLPKSNRQQMEEVMQRILNREDFSYDMNADALFQQYKDKFAKQGRLAMEDAMGKAAALTGGYGNSYAQSVGQQAYYDRLGQLDGIVPELYSLAKQKHDAEGDALWKQYNLLAGREADDYSRELAQQEYEAAKKAEERDRAYSLALQMLQSGVMPSEGLLSGSGISAEDAQKIYGAYAVPSYSGGGGYADRTEYSDDTLKDDEANNVTDPVNIPEFGDIKRTVQYASPERFEEIMALYEDYLTQEQLDELAAIYANRGLGV